MKKLTNFFNCAAKAAQKTGGGTSQQRGHQLGVASVITSTLSRFDCVSLASRLRVLDNIRGISALFSSRVLKYAAVMLMVLTLGVGNAWGTDVTFTTTSGSSTPSWSGTTSTSESGTVGDYTVTFNKNTSGSSITMNNSYIGTVKGMTIVVSSTSKTFTKVILNFSSKDYGPNKKDDWENRLTASSGSITKKSDTQFEWSGEASSSITFNHVNNGTQSDNNYRFTSIIVTPYSSGTSTYSVTYNGNGKTSGDVPADSNSPYAKDATVTVLGNTGNLEKTNYTFTGWNTKADGSGTHYDAGATFSMGTSNVTLYAEWELSLTTHTPGKYTTAQASSGYGADLITYNSRKYEVYYVTYTSSKLYICAGNLAYNATGHYNLIDGVTTSADAMYLASDSWFGIAANSYGNSGSINIKQFNVNASRHAATLVGSNCVKLKVSGYDNFAFIGRDGSSSGDNTLVVKIDGESQTEFEHKTTDPTVYSFDITTGEHVIEVTTAGGGSNRFRGFSLRLPCTLTYDANGGTGTMENTTGSGTTTLRTNTYTKSGCSFIGWATSQANANAGTVAYEDGATNYNLSADATLYAVWKLDAPTITCEDNVVTMTVPGGATVYYTTDGSTTPTSGSTPYDPSNKPVIAATATFKAIAILANHVSSNVTTQACEYVAPTPPSTKRIYMKCGSTWCNLEPKFFLRSWGTETHTVEMTQMTGCETDTYYGDIPAGNTGLLFTRQNNTTTDIIWSGDDFWGQSVDITIGDDNLFTCTGWNSENPAKATFDAGTYATPTYTISFAGNGNTDGEMSDISSLACGSNQAITANAFTKNGYSFANWTADVAVTVGGETVSAGSAIANQATIQNISGDITLTAQWTQEVPTSVSVDGTWRGFPGQTIRLTATPTGGTSDFTYQWQKYVTNDWQDIDGEDGATYSKANCTISDCGSYRCIVSKLGGSVESNAFDVHIYTLNGNYNGSDWVSNDLTVVSGTTGKVELTLEAGRLYTFKVKDNFTGAWFGNSGYMLKSETGWTCPSDNNDHIRVFTGAAGTYTFTVDIAHVDYGTPQVEVDVTYPSVTHPAAGYVYYDKGSNDWTNIEAHWWKNEGTIAFVDWEDDPWMTQSVEICGTTYYYMPKLEGYDRLIFHKADESGSGKQTPDITVDASSSGKYISGNVAEWKAFAKYTISFEGNGKTSGEMSAIANLECGANQTLPANAFEKSGYTFSHWTADVDVTVGESTITAGNTIESGVTLKNINSDITLTAQWDEIPTYTISLDANGGSIESYDGWTKVGDVYSMTVEEGTEVSLLAFTKADVQLLFFRDGSANEYTSAVTLNADLSLKAVWGEEKEVTIYSWESPDGTAIEVGGTATHYTDATTPHETNQRVNYKNTINSTDYYTICLNGTGYDGNQIHIALDANIKTGDNIQVWAYRTKNENSSPRMDTQAGVEIFADNVNVQDISSSGTPTMHEFTVPSGINTDAVKMTRKNASTACFITKLVITGNRVVEVLDPAATPSITVQPVGANYTWKESVSALTVTASVTDGGTLHYQWYKEAGETDTKVGTDAASYTPTEAGTYYVIVTNKKTGYADATTTSNNATVTIGTRPSYTVTYYDGASSLGTESVLEEANPAEYAAKQAKAVYGVTGLYEFNGWYNNSDLAEAHKIANIAALSITANTPIYGKWTRIEATNVDLVEYVSADGHLAGNESTDAELNTFKTWFTGQGYVYANLYKLDKTTNNNGAYSGLKTRSTDAYVAFNVPANKRVTVKLGSMAAAAEMYINGVKNESQALTGGSTSTGNDNYADWKYDVTEASTFKLQMKSSSTCVVKAITIGEIPAASDDATLSDLKVDGTTVDGFAASTLDYYVELPYGTEDAPAVAGTANDAKAKSVTPTQAESLPGNATIVVVAEDNTTSKTYTVHFFVAPKLGVELIKATHTGATTASKTGYWKDDVTVDKSTQDGGKLGSDDHYFGLTLGTNKFMNGDLLCIYLKISETESQWLQVFKDKGSNIIVDQQSGIKRGANYFTLSGLPEGGIDELYVYRTTTAKSKMNPYVDYIAVYREMDPFFESFTVAGVAATIDETVSPKTISVEVPAVTDITELVPTYKAWANGGATVSPTTAQDFSAGAIDYTVTSEYSETTTYKVTVTKAAAIKEVVISGTLTVMEDNTTTLSAAVYDTNEALAANQNVTWSVKSGDESLAEVDANGVVTGKAVGTAHIIATSVADDSKSAEVAVTVTENPCRVWNAPTSSWSDALVTVGKLQIARGDCPASNSMVPYSGAGTMYGIKIDGSAKFIELTMSDGAQFESLTLGVTSNSNGSSPKYVVVASSAKTFDADAVLSAVEYVANAKDAEQSLNVISLPTGTRNVRLYRTYDAKGDGASVFLYYINACKKDLVALTSVAVADKSLATGVAGVPVVTLTPANADVVSYAWEIVSDATGAATINATTGAISSTEMGAITVKVTATDALNHVVESNICTVTIVDIVERADVTGSMTWNWNGAGTANVSVATDRGLALANYISGDAWKYISGTNGDYAYNTNNSGSYQGNGSLSFRTTVPGLVKITGKRISDNAVITINGAVTAGTLGESVATLNAICVAAGEVTITPDSKGMRITKIEFDANLVPAEAEESFLGGYERTVDPKYYGTVCLPKAGVMTGATLFKVAYMDYKEDGVTPYKVYYDEVENGTMQAGMPYIFLAEQSTIGVYYTGTAEETAKDHNGLHGTLVNITEGMNAAGIYMFYNNRVVHSTNAASKLPANRAYLQISEIQGYNDPNYQAPAPTRRRISTGFNGANGATGLENIQAVEGRVQKVLIDGKIYILRGEKIFDATGRLVK